MSKEPMKVALTEKLSQFSDYFAPRTVAEFNGHDVMVTKLKGPRGVEHRPVAQDEVHVLLIEATGTPNTGDPRTAAPRRRL